MIIFNELLGLLYVFLKSGIWEYIFIPVFCLAFISVVPILIRSLWEY